MPRPTAQDLAFHGAGVLVRLGCDDDADGDAVADSDDHDANDDDADDDEHKWK